MEYLDVPYDFIESGGELMLELRAPDGYADEDNAELIYDGVSSALLVRDSGRIIRIPDVPEPYRELLKTKETVMVSETEDGYFSDAYEARVKTDYVKDGVRISKSKRPSEFGGKTVSRGGI